MKKDEYIQEVISRIENKKARTEVEREISAHIDDRISYYTDAGWDEETANEKAIEHMGEPWQVAIQMSRLHKGIKGGELFAMLLPLGLFSLLVMSDSMINHSEGSFGGFSVFIEAAYYLLLLLFSEYGKRLNNRALTSVCFISFFAYITENISLMFIPIYGTRGIIYSSVIINLALITRGKIDAELVISEYAGIRPALWVTVLTLVLLLTVLVILFINMATTFRKSTVRIRAKRFFDILGKVSYVIAGICAAMMLQFVALFVIGNISDYLSVEQDNGYSMSDHYHVFESDKPVNLSDVEESAVIDYSFDWDPYFCSVSFISGDYDITLSEDDFEYTEESYLGICNYRVCTAKLEYKPKKDYVCVIPLNWSAVADGYDYSDESHEWLKTCKDNTLVFEYDVSNRIELIIHSKD